MSAELLKTQMPKIVDTKSYEVVPVDEAIRDKEKSRHQNVRKTEAEHFVAPDDEASHDCSVRKKQWVCTWWTNTKEFLQNP